MSLGNNDNPLKARMQGVRVARDGTAASSGKPQTVTTVIKGEIVFVGYNDTRGEARSALFFKVGDQYYAPKDTEQWCASLRPMTDWIAAGVLEKLKEERPVAIPRTDSVDVLDDGTEEGDASP